MTWKFHMVVLCRRDVAQPLFGTKREEWPSGEVLCIWFWFCHLIFRDRVTVGMRDFSID